MDITLTQTPKPHPSVAVVLSVVPTMDEKTERSTKSWFSHRETRP